jgi:competence protein ComEC
MKAGHHGSRTANSELWLEAVRPKFVVISCGRDNQYGHPHPQALKRIRTEGAKVLRTDVSGDIRFEATPSGFEPVPVPY